MTPVDQPDDSAGILAFLSRINVIDPNEVPVFTKLEGGVSSDIWHVATRRGPFCLKRALPKLKTRKDWYAPVGRNASEAEWLRVVNSIAPKAIPRLLGEDREQGMFVMEYLDQTTHPVWKAQLRDGETGTVTAATVGAVVGTIHAATADNPELARRFDTDEIFHDIRIEPYLLRTAESHPDLAGKLKSIASETARTRRVLVHGDVSPKNILVGPKGPVILDAECAWYGEPAFDLAFCLNHLLLKCIWRPHWTESYIDAFAALAENYFGHVAWEQPSRLEARAAALLPALMLARIDGASPVEYITESSEQERVRRIARRALLEPCGTLGEFCRLFRSQL